MKCALIVLATVLLPGPQDPAPDHPVHHRILWTWDTWICDYDSEGKSYITEYKDLIDWMAKNGFNGLVIWGFVDGRHGGEAAAKEVARYARTKGIRILPGVSTDVGAYGSSGGFVLGIPDHPYSDATQVAAMVKSRRPGERNLCASRPENREWLRKGTEWLLDTFEIDGISLEAAEGGLRCRCKECQERLASQGGPTGGASYSDLSLCVPIVADAFRKKRPGGLVTYAAHRPLWWEQSEAALEMLKTIPDACVAQWNLERDRRDAPPSPVERNLALIHGGGFSYHLRKPRPAERAFNQYRCFYPELDDIRNFCANLRAMKFDGFVVGSAGSHKNPDAEIAYLAFIEFSEDPKLDLGAFYARHIPRLYGADAAGEVSRLFAAQAAVHRQSLPYWRNHRGTWEPASTGKARAAADSLAGQIALARSAASKATADGKSRLDAIIAILDEYRIVCDAAASGPFENLQKLAEFYEKAGLPEDIYRYNEWKP